MAVAVISPATDYAQRVISGEIVAGKLVRLACQRHLNDLKHGAERGLKFDDDAAQQAIDFFENVLVLTDGAFAGKPFVLQPFQKFIVGSLFGWKGSDGYRRFRTAYIETGKGSGKALAIDTPIPTPSGWAAMGDLHVGDRVFDETGVVCSVLAVTETMRERPCYRLTFSDGETIIADAEHLWRTAALRSGGAKGPKPADAPRKGGYALRTTEQIAATYKLPPTSSLHPQAVYNHRVDVAGALDLPDADLPVPPYTLGAWLGDGDSDCARLTNAYADNGILTAIREEGVSVAEQQRHSETTARLILGSGGTSQLARGFSLQSKLRRMGLLGNKHIPPMYLRASEAQRTALLQGLLDTDGSVCRRTGQIEYCSTSPRLAADTLELIRSLGLKPTSKESDAKIDGRVVGRRFRVTFHCDNSRRLFRLDRKAELQRARPLTRPLSRGRMIVGCELIPWVPVKCISVSSPSQMYLAGRAMIPTHNSPLAAGIGLFGLTMDGEAGAEIYAAAVTRDQAKILFADAEKMGEGSSDLAKELEFTVNNIAHPGSQSFFRAISAEARALDGKRVHMALIDEIHEHPNDMVWEKMRAGTKNRQQALIMGITNSGYDRLSVCYRLHTMSKQILEGIIENDSWFSYICQLDSCDAEGHQNPVPGCPDCDDWTDEAVWLKVQPGLDTIMPRKYMREQVAEAQGMPGKLNIVLRLNFCVWCVIRGTLVTMADGSRKKAEDLLTGDMILAFDETTGQLVPARVGAVRDNGIQPVFTVETRRGRRTTVTGNHRFWARTGDRRAPQDRWVEAQHLSIGSRIAAALGNRLPRGSRRINAEVARFFGIMVGDGTCNGSPRLTSSNEDVTEFVRQFVAERGDQLRSLPDGVHFDVRHRERPSRRRTATRRLLQKYGLWGKIDRTKRVPEAVFKGGVNVWAAFLSGYLDADGWITAAGVGWASCNRPLLEDCQHLLSLLGIQSTVSAVTESQYRLEVSDGIGRQRLVEILSPEHTMKAVRLKALGALPVKPMSAYGFDLVSAVKELPPQPTIGIEVEKYHTHVTDGLITHNTEQANRWLQMDAWDQCADPVDAMRLRGRACWLGIDLSSTTDLTAAALVFEPDGDDVIDVLMYYWLPEDGMRKRVAKDRVPYDVWTRQGCIETTDGNVVDYDAIIERVKEFQGLGYNIRQIAMDPWNATSTATKLMAMGFEVVYVRQGYASLNEPCKELERRIMSKGIRHGGNPVLRWNAANIAIESDAAGNIKPNKEHSTERIDGIAALVDALSVSMVGTDGVSVYEERGVIAV